MPNIPLLRNATLGIDFGTSNSAMAVRQRGAPLPRNPFLDLRVRRALSIAIDRQALATAMALGTDQQILLAQTIGRPPP